MMIEIEMEVKGGSASPDGVISVGVVRGSVSSVEEGTCALHCNA